MSQRTLLINHAQLIQRDGFGPEFTLIYRELSAFKTHGLFLVLGSGVSIFTYYFASKFWQDNELLRTKVGPSVLAASLALLSFYNLRGFYNVPRRLYFNHRTNTYRILLNRVVPWARPLVIELEQKDITQVKSILGVCNLILRC